MINKSTKTTRQHSQHLKTEQSSKMPSISKEMDKKPKKKVKGKEKEKFSSTHQAAAETFYYKWGIYPQLFENNSHKPKGNKIKGIKYE